jgi:hypothetical protein
MPRAISLGLSLLIGLTGCGGGVADEASATTPPATPSPAPVASSTPFPYTTEPVAIDPGTYLIPGSAWSVADLTITFPEDWTVQYGHVYAKLPDTEDEFGFYAVGVDAIFADACVGSDGELMEFGDSGHDLVEALRKQRGPALSGPVETTLGGYPATRIDLTVPEGFDLTACNAADIGLQIWYSLPTDKNFVLLRDGIGSAYILDVEGQRQVFLAQRPYSASDENLAELQTVLDSIHIER